MRFLWASCLIALASSASIRGPDPVKPHLNSLLRKIEHEVEKSIVALDLSSDRQESLRANFKELANTAHQVAADGVNPKQIALHFKEMLHDIGMPRHVEYELEGTTQPSELDKILDELNKDVKAYLPLIGPLLGLNKEQINGVVDNFDKFCQDIEATEHYEESIAQGIVNICTDILEILKIFGVNVVIPTGEATDIVDEVITLLKDTTKEVLDILLAIPQLHLNKTQIHAIESDVDALTTTMRLLADGDLDVDTGIQQMLQEIENILKDCGVPDTYNSNLQLEETTEPSAIDKLLDQLEKLLNQYLPLAAKVLGLTDDQVKAIEDNFDKFVKDVKALEHGQVTPAEGVKNIADDILEIMKAFGFNPVMPTDDTPTTLDKLLQQLEAAVDEAITILGPILGLDAKKIKEDLGNLIQHLKDVEHGTTPVDDGMEEILNDIIQLLKDFGAPVMEHLSSLKSIDDILEQLEKTFDTVFPLMAQALGFTTAEVTTIETDVHSFVADFEAIEHGDLNPVAGIEKIVQDIMKLVNDFNHKK